MRETRCRTLSAGDEVWGTKCGRLGKDTKCGRLSAGDYMCRALSAGD